MCARTYSVCVYANPMNRFICTKYEKEYERYFKLVWSNVGGRRRNRLNEIVLYRNNNALPAARSMRQQ